MRFHSPEFLLLLFLLPVFLGYRPKRQLTASSSKTENAFVFSSTVELSELPTSLRQKLKTPLLGLIKATAFVLLILALSRPQSSSAVVETQSSGRDIMLTLDISGSMLAIDFRLEGKRVERLTALKHVVNSFIDGRPGDRFGLVIFGDTTYTQCPLTTDQNTIKEFVNNLQIGMAGQGTAIGDGLGISIKRITEIPAESKVIILVTDGKNNAGTLSPKQAALLAKKKQIKVHVIGIGDNGYAPMPAATMFGTVQYVNTKMEFDEATLREIAEITGGQYFNAKNMEQLTKVYQEIDKLEERSQKQYQYLQFEEHYLDFAVLGLVLFLLYEILSSSFFITIP
jgi:Ca-activated chloride channel family protein